MSTALQIEAAIKQLSAKERQKLIEDLPELLPELLQSPEWEEIHRDPTPRPALSKLGDELAAEFSKNPEDFPKIAIEDFDRNT
jgi:hypothetical protein